ncbi:PepSY domain-containing protein [Pseudogracilibacillus sp. SO10305]|uniref:PepSY domain-containing protein n=1 Tax=Pseudogracilibacillus sp. SO10305 TaxID=3098292 RepID=UPI00300E037D
MDKKMTLRVVIATALILVIGTVGWQVFITPNSKQLAISKVEAQEIAGERYDGEIVGTEELSEQFIITIQSDLGEYEIKISRATGEVESVEQIKATEQPKQLSEQEVEEIVLKNAPGEIKEMSKSTEDKVEYYDAVVKDADEKTMIVKVHSETGEVVEKTEQKPAQTDKKQQNNSSNDKTVAKQEKKDQKKAENQENKEQKKEQKQEKKEPEKEKKKNISEAEAIQIALNRVAGEVDDVDLESSNGQLYYFVEIETADDLEAEIQIHAISGKIVSIEWDD